jgi:hypothetical protein
MPIAAFDMRRISGHRRERIEAVVVTGDKHLGGPHPDRFRGGFQVLITAPHGFERTVAFAVDDDLAVIAERVRETVEEYAGTRKKKASGVL